MKKYSEAEKARILAFPIESILSHLGKRTDHRGYMYYSPLRTPEERTPSFKIDKNKNLWCDHGSATREGGNNLHLVSRLLNIPLSEAWEFIAGLDPLIITRDEELPVRRESSNHPSAIVIDSVYDSFLNKRFPAYAASRGIPKYILERYCSHVVYHYLSHPQQQWHAIGFPTGDGWVLRHATSGPYSKRCTGSACSFLGHNGERTEKPTSDRVEVFEGFFDFLSWLVMKDRTKPFTDICVLNSVSNTAAALDYISEHANISCWLDNDKAGLEAFKTIKERCSNARSHFNELKEAGCNDVNDLLIHTRQLKPSTNFREQKGKGIKIK